MRIERAAKPEIMKKCRCPSPRQALNKGTNSPARSNVYISWRGNGGPSLCSVTLYAPSARSRRGRRLRPWPRLLPSPSISPSLVFTRSGKCFPRAAFVGEGSALAVRPHDTTSSPETSLPPQPSRRRTLLDQVVSPDPNSSQPPVPGIRQIAPTCRQIRGDRKKLAFRDLGCLSEIGQRE
jgi:hypothetical protein